MRSRPPLDRFLAAVHRRVVVVRALECAGIALAVAAGIALAVGGLLIWRGERGLWPLMVAGMLLAGGAGIGLLWGLLRRPSRLWTAIEADRQLGLHDLLSTAWATRHSADPWVATVRALAEAQCQALHPRQVILHRLGVRAWGGIVSMLLLAGGLLALYAQPAATVAGEDRTGFIPTNRLDALVQAPRPAPLWTPEGRVPPAASPAQPGMRSGRDLEPARPQEGEGENAPPAAAGDPGTQVASATGAGGGAGQSDETASRGPRSTDPSGEGHADPADARPGDTAHVAAGAGDSHALMPAQGVAGAPTVARPSGVTAEPWHASTWPAQREAALRALSAGQTPPAYRDLIRAYFTSDDR